MRLRLTHFEAHSSHLQSMARKWPQLGHTEQGTLWWFVTSSRVDLRVDETSTTRGEEVMNLDVAARVEAVQLVHYLQHRPLHLVVAALPVIEARPANRVDLRMYDRHSRCTVIQDPQ